MARYARSYRPAISSRNPQAAGGSTYNEDFAQTGVAPTESRAAILTLPTARAETSVAPTNTQVAVLVAPAARAETAVAPTDARAAVLAIASARVESGVAPGSSATTTMVMPAVRAEISVAPIDTRQGGFTLTATYEDLARVSFTCALDVDPYGTVRPTSETIVRLRRRQSVFYLKGRPNIVRSTGRR